MSAARRLKPARARAVEELLHEAAGQRSRWRVDVLAPNADGLEHRAYTTTGEGPLGRLRAHQRAREWAARAGLALDAIESSGPRRKPSAVYAWEHAHLLARLRAQGVL